MSLCHKMQDMDKVVSCAHKSQDLGIKSRSPVLTSSVFTSLDTSTASKLVLLKNKTIAFLTSFYKEKEIEPKTQVVKIHNIFGSLNKKTAILSLVLASGMPFEIKAQEEPPADDPENLTSFYYKSDSTIGLSIFREEGSTIDQNIDSPVTGNVTANVRNIIHAQENTVYMEVFTSISELSSDSFISFWNVAKLNFFAKEIEGRRPDINYEYQLDISAEASGNPAEEDYAIYGDVQNHRMGSREDFEIDETSNPGPISIHREGVGTGEFWNYEDIVVDGENYYGPLDFNDISIYAFTHFSDRAPNGEDTTPSYEGQVKITLSVVLSRDEGTPPVCTITGEDKACVGEEVVLTADYFDTDDLGPRNDELLIEWKNAIQMTNDIARAIAKFDSSGDHIVKATVTDNEGQRFSTNFVVSVESSKIYINVARVSDFSPGSFLGFRTGTGHTWISVYDCEQDKFESFGFFPGFIFGVLPGVINNTDKFRNDLTHRLGYEVDVSQVEKMYSYINKYQEDSTPYHLLKNNCTDFAASVMQHLGLQMPPYQSVVYTPPSYNLVAEPNKLDATLLDLLISDGGNFSGGKIESFTPPTDPRVASNVSFTRATLSESTYIDFSRDGVSYSWVLNYLPSYYNDIGFDVSEIITPDPFNVSSNSFNINLTGFDIENGIVLLVDQNNTTIDSQKNSLTVTNINEQQTMSLIFVQDSQIRKQTFTITPNQEGGSDEIDMHYIPDSSITEIESKFFIYRDNSRIRISAPNTGYQINLYESDDLDTWNLLSDPNSYKRIYDFDISNKQRQFYMFEFVTPE